MHLNYKQNKTMVNIKQNRKAISNKKKIIVVTDELFETKYSYLIFMVLLINVCCNSG